MAKKNTKHGICRLCKKAKELSRDFAKWANIGMDINSKYNFEYAQILLENVNPLFILKQIVSMFICMNDTWLTEEYSELPDFVKDPENRNLHDRYKVYTYHE